jgi:GTP-binding protein
MIPGLIVSDAARTASGEVERLFTRPWRFVLSAPTEEALPPADRAEIAIAGRSNVGKSSLINALVRQRGLARTSNTPGRTQELNFFAPAETALYLVDMPGYGFAKAPKDKVDAWTRLVKNYLRGRPTLRRVFLLIDARQGIKPIDREVMRLLDEAAVSFQIVLTKSDKLPPKALEAVAQITREAARESSAAFPEIAVTSAIKSAGLDELRAAVASLAAQDAEGRRRSED